MQKKTGNVLKKGNLEMPSADTAVAATIKKKHYNFRPRDTTQTFNSRC